jgi:SSS family solute:Na+ symporter
VFVQEKSATGLGICKLIVGKNALLGFPWNGIDAQIIALPISALIAILVSLGTTPPPSAHIEKCFRNIGNSSR